MKKLILIFICFSCLAQSPTVDDLKMRVYLFEKHYDIFFRKLYGCKLGVQVNKETCISSQSIIDYKDYELARRAAKQLFP